MPVKAPNKTVVAQYIEFMAQKVIARSASDEDQSHRTSRKTRSAPMA